jgi:hypothetical protein
MPQNYSKGAREFFGVSSSRAILFSEPDADHRINYFFIRKQSGNAEAFEMQRRPVKNFFYSVALLSACCHIFAPV